MLTFSHAFTLVTLALALCISQVLSLVGPVAAAPYPQVPGKYFDHIFIILFENEGAANTQNDPNFKAISDMGTLLTNYHGVTHPSQPNYIALTSGDFYGHNVDTELNLDNNHIGDLLDAKGVSWMDYQENFPGNCNGIMRVNDYVRKHNPFMSYTNINGNLTRCNQRIVNASQLDIDLNSGNVPNYMFYTPTMQNDGHDSSLAFAGKFAKSFVDSTLSKFPNRTLFVLTWDEDDNYFSPDRVMTVLLGDLVTAGATNSNCYNHYSLLRLVEENWDLGSLGRNDAKFPIIDIAATGGPSVGSCPLNYTPDFSIRLVASIVVPVVVGVIIIVVIIILVVKRCCCFKKCRKGAKSKQEMK